MNPLDTTSKEIHDILKKYAISLDTLKDSGGKPWTGEVEARSALLSLISRERLEELENISHLSDDELYHAIRERIKELSVEMENKNDSKN